MATNRLPDALPALFTLAEDMADGLNAHEAAIGVKQTTEASLRASLTAAQTAQSNFSEAQGGKAALSTAVTVADSNGKAFIAAARNVLMNSLGSGWSQTWEPTGFPNQSIAVPTTQAERQALLGSLQAYFTATPTQENAPLNVTAAQAGVLFNVLSTARSALNGGLTDSGQKKAARDAAVNALRRRMRGLIDELAVLVTDDDPRWLAFGVNLPGAPDTPGIPETLILTPGTAGRILADWADSPRAERYRVFKQVVGADADFVSSLTVTDSDATLSGLPSGAVVRVRVTALNNAGESQPGAVAELVVP